jgi:signal transduction histidine kinase
LAHDLRNHLNAAELQAAYLGEIAENEELREEIKRLRGMVAQVALNLQEVTAALSQPPLTEMPYAASELIEDLQQKLATAYPAESANVKWEIADLDAQLNIDPQLLLPALLELFANAFRHERGDGPIEAKARTENGRFVFTLSEPKRRVIEAHKGEFAADYDKAASSLLTTISLPPAPPADA